MAKLFECALIKMNNILTLLKIYFPVMKGKRCIRDVLVMQ